MRLDGKDIYLRFLELRDGCRLLVFADTGGGGISVDALDFKKELQDFLSDYSG